LSPASIRKLIETLAAILDDAIEDELIDRNPARGKRMRVHAAKPDRTFLEMDELAVLLDTAAAQDRQLREPAPTSELGTTSAVVAYLLDAGYTPAQVASRLGLAKSTINYHVQRLRANVGRGYVGRRITVEILARAGVQVSELCDMRVGHFAAARPRRRALSHP